MRHRPSLLVKLLCGLLLGALLVTARALRPGPSGQKEPHATSPPGEALRPPPLSEMAQKFAVPVLMYHRICDLTEQEARSPLLRDLTVAPGAFDEQMRFLTEQGFTPLLAREVEEAVRYGRALPRRAIAITMDDGYKDNFEQAFPILQKYRIPATIFLVTSVVGEARHLSWEDVTLMHRDGFGFGSHTIHHFDLTLLPTAQLDYELQESRRVIEARLIERITAIAYPAGQYNQHVAARARSAGYLAGWKKGGGPVRPGEDLYLLPRIRVRGPTTMDQFRRKVTSGLPTMAD